MKNYEVVTASIRHVKPLSASLRGAHCANLLAFNIEPRRALHDAFLASPFCRTALIEGRPVAMWGVKSDLISPTGFAWLVISNEITGLSLSIIKETKKQLAEMMKTYHELAITVLPDDFAALRFAVFLGFHDRDQQMNQSRKISQLEIVTDPRNRVPYGDGHIIALGYHHEERAH
jgi:hypothetical protein